MAGRLFGKVAVVMGAGSSGPGWGNGKATAVTFAREGALVVCADINEAAAEETAGLIRAEGFEASAIRCDVTKLPDVETVAKAAIDTFGRIDVLHNNVGIAVVGGVVELSEADWDRAFSVNVKGVFLAMKVVLPIMERQGSGSIINVSSIVSLRYSGIPYASYYSTKAALNHLTKTTAVEYASRNIRVNAVLPGLMKTPMVAGTAGLVSAYGDGDVEAMWRERDRQVPMGHMGEAWDVAWAALFLASDEARYVTGLELVVDGGVTLKY